MSDLRKSLAIVEGNLRGRYLIIFLLNRKCDRIGIKRSSTFYELYRKFQNQSYFRRIVQYSELYRFTSGCVLLPFRRWNFIEILSGKWKKPGKVWSNRVSDATYIGDSFNEFILQVKSFIPENEKGIQIPNCGRLQVGIFNTEESLIKVFTVSYDLADMPRCSKTFLRHSNYFTPKCTDENNVKWLQSFLQLK